MERFAYRPLRNAPRLAPLITAIGVSVFLQEAVRLFYPGAKSKLPFPPIEVVTGPALQIGGLTIQRAAIFTVGALVICAALLWYFVNRTRLGRGMQAVSQDPDTARLMGINVDRIIVVAFVLGAVLAAVAGVAQGLQNQNIDFRIGFLAGLKAFTAAVLGGIGNIQGAVARRPGPRRGRGLRHAVHPRPVRRVGVEGRVGLRAPHPRPRLPAARPPRRKGGGPGMSDRLDSLRERYRRLGWPLGLAGAVLLAAGTFLSWSYVATILGNLSVYVYPGSVQLFALFLALVAIAFLLMYRGPLHRLGDWFKSALAVRTLGLGSAVFMTIVLLLIAVQSGGLINIDPGGWVSWVGSLLLAAGGQLMQVRAINDPIKAKLPGWVEILVIVILLALALFGSAFALGQEDGSVFLLFFVALGTAIWALASCGFFTWIGILAARHRRVLMLGGVRRRVPLPVHPGRVRREHVDRDPGHHLRGHGAGPEHRRRPRRPARPRVHRLPRRRRLHRRRPLRLGVRHGRLEAAVPARRPHRRLRLGHPRPHHRHADPARLRATTSPSSPWPSGRSSG